MCKYPCIDLLSETFSFRACFFKPHLPNQTNLCASAVLLATAFSNRDMVSIYEINPFRFCAS